MKATFAALGLCFTAAACSSLPEPAPETEAAARPVVQVMVLGTFHMNNPGADLVNMNVDDVLSPARQEEMKELVSRLAAFQPTAIMVESESQRPDFLDERYLTFDPALLETNRNETVQVGYRLAHELGIRRVYGVDTRKGEIDFFPFGRVQQYEEERGISLTGPMLAEVQTKADQLAGNLKTMSLAELIAIENDPESLNRMHSEFYYGLFELADAADQPGAVLNYSWYARNAHTFAKIAATTEPGDRVVVLFGSGHAYWLRHFASATAGYELVEPVPYLVD